MFQKKKIFSKAISTPLIVILLFLVAFLIFAFSNLKFKQVVIVSGHKIDVEIVKTIEDQRRGLGNRNELKNNTGMLFVYEDYNIPHFWMKDMKFPIDIIWINDDMVVGYDKDLQPVPNNIELPIYQPKTFVNYVLEVNSGFVEENGIRIGDKVGLPF